MSSEVKDKAIWFLACRERYLKEKETETSFLDGCGKSDMTIGLNIQ